MAANPAAVALRVQILQSGNEFVDNGAPPDGAFFTRGWGVNGAGFGSADHFGNRRSVPGARQRPWDNNANNPKPGGTRESATAAAQQENKSRGVAFIARETGASQQQTRERRVQEENGESAE